MRSVKIALAVATALIVVAICAVLAHSPLAVAGSNSVQAPTYRNGSVVPNDSNCQTGGTIPTGTTALRISLGSNVNPKIGVKVFAGSRLITQGALGAGGALNADVTVPVRRVESTVHGALVCIMLGPSAEEVGIRGIPVRPPVNGVDRLSDVQLGIEYLSPSSTSWWSRVPSIAYHFGLGRAFSGTWIVFLVLALMLTVGALAWRLTLRELR